MIKYPLFYRMRIAEYITFSDRVFNLILEAVTESITLEPFKTRIENSKNKLEESQKKVNTQLLTINVADCDARRDQALIAFETYALACSKRLDLAISAAGKIILNEIKSNGSGITRRPMLEESAIINGLVEKIKTNSTLSESLTTIQGMPWLEEVEKSQEDFTVAVEKRGDAKMNRNEDQGGEVCKEIRKEFEAFFKYLDVMCDLETDPVYNNLAKEINIVSEETNKIVLQRVGRIANDDVEEPVEE